MALDLFVNFERTENSNVFYRRTSTTPYTCVVKLSNLDSTPEDHLALSSNFFAEYSLNNSLTYEPLNLLSGASLSFLCNTVRTSCVSVKLYSLTDLGKTNPLETYTLSAAFINQLPVARWIAYPQIVLNETTGEQIVLDETNYNLSRGISFYGEGHTETIFLSSVSNATGLNQIWYVGNYLNELDKPSAYTVQQKQGNVFRTLIPTSSSQNDKIPISLRYTNSLILSTGPVVYYDDTTGEKKFYSFFSSSLTPNNEEGIEKRFVSSIHVKPYPSTNSFEFISPFQTNLITLPQNYSEQNFVSKLIKINETVFTTTLSSTTWNIAAEVDSFSANGNWSYTTLPLREITGYQFPLAYDKDFIGTPSILKVSGNSNTLVTASVSARKIVHLDYPPHDWNPRLLIETHTDTAAVLSLPSVKIYAPNYYNLLDLQNYNTQTNTVTYGVKFYVEFDNPNYTLSEVKILASSAALSSKEIILQTPEEIKNPFYINFTKLGTQSLTAISTITNDDETLSITNIFNNIIDVSNVFDNTTKGESYYKTSDTKSEFSITRNPVLSPNEWAVEDNINASITALYTLADEMKRNVFLYEKTSFFYAWLGGNKYAWSDLECTDEAANKLSWQQNICTPETSLLTEDEGGFPLFWNQQVCDFVAKDPSCFQKYCIEWKWNQRKRRPASLLTTWSSTKSIGTYAKRWKYEPCETDSTILNCDKGVWHLSTIDPTYFPIPFCSINEQCKIKGCVKLLNGQIILAYSSELNLMSEHYEPRVIARRGIADEIFNFTNIENIVLNSKRTKLYVLDSSLPRVGVYDVTDNGFKLLNAWGKFGLTQNSYGFNKPSDIYVDPKTELVYVTDTGNACIKVYSAVGKHVKTILLDEFTLNAPKSVCLDSKSLLHVLTSTTVYVLNTNDEIVFQYDISSVTQPTKIATSYNQEIIYVSHATGVKKYFRTGTYFGDLVDNLLCANGAVLTNFNTIHQDEMRNVFVTINDNVLKFPDKMKIEIPTTFPLDAIYWSLNNLLVHKEEFIQPWVYLKAFHRLWDNIEIVRTFLPYNKNKDQKYLKPVYSKEDLAIGQNEVVTNSVVNRLITQLWSNLETLGLYFK